MKKLPYALLVTLACVGCGGGGGHRTDQPPVTGEVSLDVETATVSSAVSAPAGTPATTTMLVDGVETTVAVPGGTTLAAGEEVTIIPLAFPFQVTGDGILGAPNRDPNTPGEILINGVDTGLRVENAQIAGAGQATVVALKSGVAVDLKVVGPIIFGNPNGSHLRSANGLEVNWNILHPGAYPANARYSLPANGSSLGDSFVRLTFPNHPVASGTLVTSWPGVTKQAEKNTTNGVLTMTNSPGGNDRVPSGGISNVRFSLTFPQND